MRPLSPGLRRALWLVALLVGISFIGFLIRRAGSDPQLAPGRAWFIQYPLFLGQILRGDLGLSAANQSVLALVLRGLLLSAIFIAFAVALAGAISVSLALSALRHEGRLADRLIGLIAAVGLSAPPYWFALVLVMLLAQGLPLFPESGLGDSPWSVFYHLVLPVLALGLLLAPVPIRMLRQALAAAMESNHVTAMRAQGLDEEAIYRRHVRRNALLPTLGALKPHIGWLLGTAFVIEAAFKLPGLGSLVVGATLSHDYTAAAGGLMAGAVLALALRAGLDAIAGKVDPRQRGA